MASRQLLEHFRNPRNVGELAPPAVGVEVINPACGDILRLSALLEDGRVTQTAYKARGCPASIAAGSALTELMMGRSHAELSLLHTAEIERALDGLEPASKHAAQLCIDAVKQLVHKTQVKSS
jgi:nitrogen fixation protein NifU and related proteins